MQRAIALSASGSGTAHYASDNVTPTRTHHQTEVRPGQLLITVNADEGGSPEAPRLPSIASHLAAPDDPTRSTHSVEWPQAAGAKIMMSGPTPSRGSARTTTSCSPSPSGAAKGGKAVLQQ